MSSYKILSIVFRISNLKWTIHIYNYINRSDIVAWTELLLCEKTSRLFLFLCMISVLHFTPRITSSFFLWGLELIQCMKPTKLRYSLSYISGEESSIWRDCPIFCLKDLWFLVFLLTQHYLSPYSVCTI